MLLYKSGNIRAVYGESLIKRVRSENGFVFAKNTTYGLGGAAQKAYFPDSIPQAEAVYKKIRASGESSVIFGCGSNVLASDRPFRGSVLCTRELSGIARINRDAIFCLAGTTVPRLLSYCKARGLGGLEFLYGIPATIGGLVYMNGGSDGIFMDSVVRAVRIFDGQAKNLSNAQCKFGAKYSSMQSCGCLICGAFIAVYPSSQDKIEDKINYYKARRSHLPKGRSCGCVFKNPPAAPAGKLIEQAGLKGRRIGGAFVSPVHANFIINDGGTAEDVRKLILTVKREVFLSCGVTLEEEVGYIGDFNEING